MYDIELWKRRKKELNLTLDDIAKLTNISISTIKDIFRGATYAPRIDTVEAIEKALGIPEKIDTTRVKLTSEQSDWLNKRDKIFELYGQEGLQAANAMLDSYINAKK